MCAEMTTFFDERSYYERKFDSDPGTVFWGNPAGARLRFEAIMRNIELRNSTLVDVGCGYGDLLGAATASDMVPELCTGLDVVPHFVEEAKRRWPHHVFRVSDASAGGLEGLSANWVVANGLFGHSQPDGQWGERFQEVTSAMWKASIEGIAYTLVSTHSPRRNPDANYCEPAWAFADAMQRFTKAVVIDHSYLINDMLIVVRKEPRSNRVQPSA